jgi:hypothetical protein
MAASGNLAWALLCFSIIFSVSQWIIKLFRMVVSGFSMGTGRALRKCRFVQSCQDGVVTTKAVYVVVGVPLQGEKERLWVSNTEGAEFWLGVYRSAAARGQDCSSQIWMASKEDRKP